MRKAIPFVLLPVLNERPLVSIPAHRAALHRFSKAFSTLIERGMLFAILIDVINVRSTCGVIFKNVDRVFVVFPPERGLTHSNSLGTVPNLGSVVGEHEGNGTPHVLLNRKARVPLAVVECA